MMADCNEIQKKQNITETELMISTHVILKKKRRKDKMLLIIIIFIIGAETLPKIFKSYFLVSVSKLLVKGEARQYNQVVFLSVF